ncbi:unnamed protein product, partial [Allacma fusca]|jgi:hypothetical protein
MVIE